MNRGPEGIISSRLEKGLDKIRRESSVEKPKGSAKKEASAEKSLETMPKFEQILSGQEIVEALNVIVPVITGLVQSVQSKTGGQSDDILPLLSGDDSNNEELRILRKIFTDSEIKIMLEKQDESLAEFIQVELDVKLLKEREEITNTLQTPENTTKLKDAFRSVGEIYEYLNIPISHEAPATEFMGTYGDLFVESLSDNNLKIRNNKGAAEKIIPSGKVAVVIDDARKLGREETSAFKRGTIESNAYRKMSIQGQEVARAKISDIPSIEKMQLGFSQMERVDGKEKVRYKKLDIGVTELLARFSDWCEEAEHESMDEKRPYDIEARNAFILSHVVGSEKSIDSIALPTVLRGNYNDENLHIEGLRFIVRCQISEGGFSELKERVEEKMGKNALFFVDLADEDNNFQKFFSLLQKHAANETIVDGEKMIIERTLLEDYGIDPAEIMASFPFVKVI